MRMRNLRSAAADVLWSLSLLLEPEAVRPLPETGIPEPYDSTAQERLNEELRKETDRAFEGPIYYIPWRSTHDCVIRYVGLPQDDTA